MHPHGCSEIRRGVRNPGQAITAMVGVTKIQRCNAKYWIEAVAEGGDDYYSKPGEAPGQWVGGLIEELGLGGEVDAEGYAAILEGRDPTSGDQLVSRPATRFRLRPDGSERRVEPVLGYDVRFSAPKSVSILYALGDESTQARVLAVMDRAVAAGLSHLESEACFVRRGKGGARIEPGAGFVGMAFRHRMSRAGDPALHVHVLLSNLTRAHSDGKWLSLASPKGRSPLWPHAKSAGVVFQAVLRAEFLREFGLGFEEVRNGYADLIGIPRAAIDALSTRSHEIATWMAERGVDGVDAAQVAAYRTRDAKDYGVDVDHRREEWIRKADPHGVTPQRVEAMVRAARPREPRPIAETDIEAALTRLEQTNSHFDRRQLLWAIADRLPQGADLSALTTAADRAIEGGRVICIHRSRDPLDLEHFTTPRIAELERRFITRALAGIDAGRALVEAETVAGVLAAHPHLGADQREMVGRLASGGEAVVAVAARPGTGKTTALEAAKDAWWAAGIEVIGVATARTASGEIKDAGVPATSISDLLYRVQLRGSGRLRLPAGTVILVDEASMTSTPDLEALRSLVEQLRGKLVVIGDPRQVGPVGPGGLYANLVEVTEAIELTTIRRQHREADRELIALVHDGRGSEALDLLRTREQLIVGDDLPATLNGMLADWHRDFATGADVVMIARRNRDVDYLNDAARELRAGEGALGLAEVVVGERAFAAGDRVLTRINARGVDNRERWEVVAVDAAARNVQLRRLGGDDREVILNPRYLDRSTPNGEAALQHAYAVTIFGAQGKTFDRAYPLLDATAALNEQMVAISRGREVANAYLVAAADSIDELGPARREIADAAQDVREAIERPRGDHPAAEIPIRHRLEELSPTELAARRAQLVAVGRAGDPLLAERDRLGTAIERAEDWVARLGGEREALEAMAAPPPAELARIRAAEAKCSDRLRRDRAALEAHGEGGAEATAKPTGAKERLELALIEERIAELARREIAAGRLGDSHVLHRTLGSYPNEPADSLAWSKAAQAIATYRVRYGVREGSNVLGREPSDPAARAERAAAQRQIEVSRHRLLRSRERGAQISFESDLSLSI